MSAMDDNDYAQMKIDAYVKYRGYTPEMLATVAKEKFDDNEKPLLKTIENLNLLRNQNSGNQNALDVIDKNLKAATTRLESDRSEYDATLKGLYENPEQFKNKIYAMDSINQFANSFSNISHIYTKLR
jgi:ABC-type transporter Mla subunit MlaD